MKRYILICLMLLAAATAMAQKHVSDLVVTHASGGTITWYTAEGTLIESPTTTDLVNGTTYYASQTVNGVESTTRFAVTATIYTQPLGSLTANGPFSCTGGAGMLTWTETIGTGPYTIVYNDGTSNRTALSVVSGTPFATYITPVMGTTTYTLVSVQDANCTRSSGFTGGSATITVTAPTITTTGIPGILAPVCFSGSAQTTTMPYTATTNTPTSYSIEWQSGMAGQGSTPFAFAAGGGTITGILIAEGAGDGTYDGWITIKADNNCTFTHPISVLVKVVTAAPIITSSEICAGTTTISGTSEGSANIVVYAGGSSIGTTTASSEGVWTATVTAFVGGNSITAKAQSVDKCQSLASSTVTVKSSTAAPVVTSPICVGATTVYGTSESDASVTVYVNGINPVTVTASGTAWTASVPALSVGNTITAYATASGKCISAVSNSVTAASAATPTLNMENPDYVRAGKTFFYGNCDYGPSNIEIRINEGPTIYYIPNAGDSWYITISSPLAKDDIIYLWNKPAGACTTTNQYTVP